MHYKETINSQIKQNKALRLKLALQLKVTEQAIMNAIGTNNNTIKRYDAVILISTQLDVPVEQLFDGGLSIIS